MRNISRKRGPNGFPLLFTGSPLRAYQKKSEVHGNIPRILKFHMFLGFKPQRRNRASAVTFSLRKEVIQPQVLLRLPCYDFTPIMNHTLDGYLPCGLVYRLLVQSTFVM